MNISEIITIVLKVVCFILVVFVIPLIKRKYSQDKLDEIHDKIMTYVYAADQIFGRQQGDVKKEWVRKKLADLGIDVDLDLIDAEIEACVLILHNALKE